MLHEVLPAAGWTWTSSQSSPTSLTVVMTNGLRTFEFSATLAEDGTITAAVSEPIVVVAPAGTSPGTTPGTGTHIGSGSDDDDDEDEGEDDEHDEDEHEYEGGDDDD
jgi:hypothetical protein